MQYIYYQGYHPDEPWVGQFDAQVQFAQDHGLTLSGDLVTWFDLPSWLCTYNADGTATTTYNRDELLGILDTYLTTMVGRHRGQIAAWYALNELIATTWSEAAGFQTGMRHSIWYDVIGPDYIEHVLRKVRDLDPGAKIFINEGLYWAPWPDVAAARGELFYNLVADLVHRSVPLDGIGEQMHLQTSYANPSGDIDLSVYETYLQRFAALGLDVHITELDVEIRGDVNAASLQRQADCYRWAMDLAMRNPGITEIILFSLSDKYAQPNPWDPALSSESILDADYAPKPAYFALKDR
jgi:endo-1,4-beta-xylanase